MIPQTFQAPARRQNAVLARRFPPQASLPPMQRLANSRYLHETPHR